MMCWVLNNCEIRHTLQAKGIHIPNETTFVPASHNTTTDEMTILESPEAHQNLWHDLNKAGQAARVERIDQYPQPQPFRAAKDWSELIPEWGLVNNAVMIIGRRSLTKNLDLQGRAFLHSYEPDNDQTGEILASIMKGPMIVAHWINTQYYCSTVDPELFGAGDKAVHNLILGIGVMQGNLSDLKIGLPKQSVQYQGQLIHQPLRLTVFIQAPHKLVNEIIQNDWNLYQLVNNQWLRIRVIDN